MEPELNPVTKIVGCLVRSFDAWFSNLAERYTRKPRSINTMPQYLEYHPEENPNEKLEETNASRAMENGDVTRPVRTTVELEILYMQNPEEKYDE